MIILAANDTLSGVASAASIVTCSIYGMELNGTTETYKRLDQRQLASSVATIYTTPATGPTFIKTIKVVNHDTVARTFQLFHGGTADVNSITQTLSIPAEGTAEYEDGMGWQVLNNLGQLQTAIAVSPLAISLTADTANQTSTTEAIVSPVLTIPANYSTVGMVIDFQISFSAAQGATANTTPGILFQLRWGGIAGTVICSVGTITPATLLAATAGLLDGFIVIRTIGASGTAKGAMTVTDPRGTRIAAGDMSSKNGMSAAGAGVVIDTTASKDLVITCKTTVADASAITFGTGGYMIVEKL
jgi:hypothetical protein